jgi:hypothetical protein
VRSRDNAVGAGSGRAPRSSGPSPSDAELYRRGIETVLASWEAYAEGSGTAALIRDSGVAAAVFPDEPERAVYNNAVLERDLAPTARARAIAAMEAAYAAAGVTRFAAWAHETDAPMRAELERRGYTIDDSTRAMGMTLTELRVPRPQLDVGAAGWDEYVRVFGLPPALLAAADLSAFHLLFARLERESVAAAMAFDHQGDTGIYNVGTVEHARRRGFATALTALQLHEALARGRETASLQASRMAESLYAAVGFRDLGRIVEYVPSSTKQRAAGPS